MNTNFLEDVCRERKVYIFYQSLDRSVNKCIGELVEQFARSAEYQWLFLIYWNQLSDSDIKSIDLPGIDLSLRDTPYVRVDDVPYMLECSTVPKGRDDIGFYLNYYSMVEYDRFELMVRGRAITSYSNCYVGRSINDLCDRKRAMDDPEYYKSIIPNLDIKPENLYHEIVLYGLEEYKKIAPSILKSLPDTELYYRMRALQFNTYK